MSRGKRRPQLAGELGGLFEAQPPPHRLAHLPLGVSIWMLGGLYGYCRRSEGAQCAGDLSGAARLALASPAAGLPAPWRDCQARPCAAPARET